LSDFTLLNTIDIVFQDRSRSFKLCINSVFKWYFQSQKTSRQPATHDRTWNSICMSQYVQYKAPPVIPFVHSLH